MAVLSTLLVVAQNGRGANPSSGGGVWIVVGIVLAVAIGGFLLHFLLHRGYLKRGRRAENFEREEQPPGRVGRAR
jgi:hypothetical protein